MQKYIKHNAPKERSVGRRNVKCDQCGRYAGHIGKYGLSLCRLCFKEIAPRIGFKKFS